MNPFDIAVQVRTISTAHLLDTYYDPVTFHTCCRGCPEHNRRWSCPSGVPDTREFFAPYSRVMLIGVKVRYAEDCRWESRLPGHLEPVRQRTYGRVKKMVHALQLAFEDCFPGAYSIAAGRCEQCAVCTRPSGQPCAKPDRMRYSFSAFRFDLGRLADEVLDMPLKWCAEGLPEYNVILCAMLLP